MKENESIESDISFYTLQQTQLTKFHTKLAKPINQIRRWIAFQVT